MVVICAAVLLFMFRLAQYKGVPNSLVWVVVVIAIYTYIASKTTTGRYFYAVGGNEKATKLPVLIQTAYISGLPEYGTFISSCRNDYYGSYEFCKSPGRNKL